MSETTSKEIPELTPTVESAKPPPPPPPQEQQRQEQGQRQGMHCSDPDFDFDNILEEKEDMATETLLQNRYVFYWLKRGKGAVSKI